MKNHRLIVRAAIDLLKKEYHQKAILNLMRQYDISPFSEATFSNLHLAPDHERSPNNQTWRVICEKFELLLRRMKGMKFDEQQQQFVRDEELVPEEPKAIGEEQQQGEEEQGKEEEQDSSNNDESKQGAGKGRPTVFISDTNYIQINQYN
ncbi:MAG: hypothetical protein AAGG75_22770 [Bacteroidota bacterium]